MWRPDDWDMDKNITEEWWDECDGLDNVGLMSGAYEAGADAMLKEVALKLKEIYGIPDLKMEHDRMGEFIQELMEEIV
ncbi:hypothetical protein LCGC14_1561950 [marine sediment metagenome]|uniref:Uncharacterized protein n=1 Tax=marine sediment metagenome TaxID=412755 RepID=A0A0F9L3M5_9ZZZZ